MIFWLFDGAEQMRSILTITVLVSRNMTVTVKNVALESLQDSWLFTIHKLMVAQHAFDFVEAHSEGICQIMPIFIPAPFTVIPNPLYIICMVGHQLLTEIARGILIGIEFEHNTISEQYEKDTMSPGQEIDTHYMVEDLHNNVDVFQEWNFHAMQTVNTNIFKQHSEMRKHLQDRHQEMTGDLVETIQDSTNVIAGYFKDQSEWLQENLCVIYKKITNEDDCGGNDSLMSSVGVSFWESVVGLESGSSKIKDGIHAMKVEITQEMQNEIIVMKEDITQEMKNEINVLKEEIMQEMKNEIDVLKEEITHEMKDEIHAMKDETHAMKDEIHSMKKEVKSLIGVLEELVVQNKNMHAMETH